MAKRILALTVACLFTHSVIFAATMAVPTSSGIWPYDAPESYVLSGDPAQARPICLGPYAAEGEMLNVQIGLDSYADLVDLYLAVWIPILSPEFLLLTQDGGLSPLSSAGLVPWKARTRGPVGESLFGSVPASALPPGTYNLYLAAMPAGRTDALHLWQTDFFIGGWSLQEIEASAVSRFGEDGAFDAVVDALDKGYSLEQIAEAAVTGRLQADGKILGYGSSVEEAPDYPPLGFIASAGAPELKREGEAVTFSKDQIRTRFQQAAAKIRMEVLGVLLAYVFAASFLTEEDAPLYGEEAPEARQDRFNDHLSRFLVHLIELTIVGDCREAKTKDSPDGCVPCLVDDDGMTIGCAPEKGVFDLTKSFSGLGATVSGPSTLTLSGGAAEGTWTGAVTGGTGPYDYYFYWGDPSRLYTKHENVASSSLSVSHTYAVPGTYRVVTRVVDRESGNEDNSAPAMVEVKEDAAPPPAFPYNHCDVSVYGVRVTMEEIDSHGIPVRQFTVTRITGLPADGGFTGTKFTGGFTDAVSTVSVEFIIDPDTLLWHDFVGTSTWHDLETVIHAGGLGLAESGEGGERRIAGEGEPACSYITYYRESSPSTQYVNHICNEGNSWIDVSCRIK